MHTALLAVHIASGAAGLLFGPLAMLLPKRPGLHPRVGVSYQVIVALLCTSAIGLVLFDPALWWLGLIAVGTEAAAVAGWVVRRRGRPGWVPRHIQLMCGSYISFVTAFLVVTVGSPVAWVLPTLVGSPLIVLTARRFRRTRRPYAGTATNPVAPPNQPVAPN